MPDLDFGDDDEQAVLVLKGFAHRVNNDLYNHGEKGLLTMFHAFVTAHDTREQVEAKTQENRHIENTGKINLLIAIATLALVIVSAVGVFVAFVAYEAEKHTQNDPLKIFHTHAPNRVLSLFHQPPQDAGIYVKR